MGGLSLMHGRVSEKIFIGVGDIHPDGQISELCGKDKTIYPMSIHVGSLNFDIVEKSG